MKKKLDTFVTGLLIGLAGPLLGFFVYGWIWAITNARNLEYFINKMFLSTREFQSPIVSLSLIINIIPFFIFLRTSRYRATRGVLASFFIYAAIGVFLFLRK